MGEDVKFMLKQILDIIKENNKKTDKISETVTRSSVILDQQTKTLDIHTEKIEENTEELGEYNNQLALHIHRTELLENKMASIEVKTEEFDDHIDEHNVKSKITNNILKYSGLILGSIGSLLAIAKYALNWI